MKNLKNLKLLLFKSDITTLLNDFNPVYIGFNGFMLTKSKLLTCKTLISIENDQNAKNKGNQGVKKLSPLREASKSILSDRNS
jgi:hypothetical protein